MTKVSKPIRLAPRCTKRLTRHRPHHHHQRQGQARPSWSSSLSGPSQHQPASSGEDQRPRHHRRHRAPRHRHRRRLPLPPPPRRRRLWPWPSSYSSSWVLAGRISRVSISSRNWGKTHEAPLRLRRSHHLPPRSWTLRTLHIWGGDVSVCCHLCEDGRASDQLGPPPV